MKKSDRFFTQIFEDLRFWLTLPGVRSCRMSELMEMFSEARTSCRPGAAHGAGYRYSKHFCDTEKGGDNP